MVRRKSQRVSGENELWQKTSVSYITQYNQSQAYSNRSIATSSARVHASFNRYSHSKTQWNTQTNKEISDWVQAFEARKCNQDIPIWMSSGCWPHNFHRCNRQSLSTIISAAVPIPSVHKFANISSHISMDLFPQNQNTNTTQSAAYFFPAVVSLCQFVAAINPYSTWSSPSIYNAHEILQQLMMINTTHSDVTWWCKVIRIAAQRFDAIVIAMKRRGTFRRHVVNFKACHRPKSRQHDGVDERKILLLRTLLLPL